DGDYCAKLAKLPYAKNRIPLVLYLHVDKTKGEDGKFVYEVQNYSEKAEPFDFWHIKTVQGRNILDYYPRKEVKDMVLRFISAYNQKSVDIFEALFTPGIFINLIDGSQVRNDGVFKHLSYLYENFGKMRLAYLRTNDAIFSAVPYLDGFGYFSFSVTTADDKISKIEEYSLDGKYEELWVTDVEVTDGVSGVFPAISSVLFLKPEAAQRFAVVLRFDNGEVKKYVLPIDRNAAGDEVVKYKWHSFTDKIWSNGWLSASRKQDTGLNRRAFETYGQGIDFINGFSLGAVQLYYDSKPYYLPKICEDVVFEDENLKITKIAEWEGCSLYSAGQGYDGDDKSDLMRVRLPNGALTFADSDGKRATALEFSYMDSFHGGVARVAIDNYGYGFIGEDMNFVIPPKYRHAKDFSEGFAVVVSEDGGNYIIDKTGRERIIANDYSGKKYKNIISCSDGMFRVSTLDEINFMPRNSFRFAYHHDDESDAGIWGFVNTQGIEVIAPQYIFAYDFVDGIALVCKGKWEEKEKWDERDNTWGWWSEEMLWGFIDKEGNEVIPCKYDEIELFQNDDYDKPERRYFKVHFGGYPDGKWGVVDRNGNWIDEPFFADVDYTISDDGCFAFYAEDKWSADDVLMGIYSIPEKRVLFVPQFLEVDFLKDGSFEVEVFDEALGRNVQKIINRQGQPILVSRYSSIRTWEEPYEVVIYDDSGDKRRILHGLVDKDGNEILPCKYSNVTWGGISPEKKRIICSGQDTEKVGMIDFDENTIIPAQYDELRWVSKTEFLSARIDEENNRLEGLLLPDGTEVLPIKFKSISVQNDRIIAHSENGSLVFRIERTAKATA
ncbi:MAG: WG repeat-containing protein, partial [Oscillospiraceae bacterium]|nr:WG repeat-containing protein [Oscillospiraceae bacterium]